MHRRALRRFWIDARTRVGYGDQDTLTADESRTHHEHAGAIGNRPHRIDGIPDQVQDDLLLLTFAGHHPRQIRRQISQNENSFRPQFGARELKNLTYDAIDEDWAPFSIGYLE